MEQEILKKLEEQEEKLQKIYISTEKMRKYFLWSLIFNVVLFILPLLGLVIAIPWFLKIIETISKSI